MRENFLNNLNLILKKKLLNIELYNNKIVEDKYNKIFNNFCETKDELITDSMLLFSDNPHFDYEYFASKFYGFTEDGWDCIDIFLK